MGDAADKVRQVIDNSNTPYGKEELSHHFQKDSFQDPEDRAAKDIIGQLQKNVGIVPKNMNYYHEDDGKK